MLSQQENPVPTTTSNATYERSLWVLLLLNASRRAVGGGSGGGSSSSGQQQLSYWPDAPSSLHFLKRSFSLRILPASLDFDVFGKSLQVHMVMEAWVYHAVNVRRWNAISRVGGQMKNRFSSGGGASGGSRGSGAKSIGPPLDALRKPSWQESKELHVRQRRLYQSRALREEVRCTLESLGLSTAESGGSSSGGACITSSSTFLRQQFKSLWRRCCLVLFAGELSGNRVDIEFAVFRRMGRQIVFLSKRGGGSTMPIAPTCASSIQKSLLGREVKCLQSSRHHQHPQDIFAGFADNLICFEGVFCFMMSIADFFCTASASEGEYLAFFKTLGAFGEKTLKNCETSMCRTLTSMSLNRNVNATPSSSALPVAAGSQLQAPSFMHRSTAAVPATVLLSDDSEISFHKTIHIPSPEDTSLGSAAVDTEKPSPSGKKSDAQQELSASRSRKQRHLTTPGQHSASGGLSPPSLYVLKTSEGSSLTLGGGASDGGVAAKATSSPGHQSSTVFVDTLSLPKELCCWEKGEDRRDTDVLQRAATTIAAQQVSDRSAKQLSPQDKQLSSFAANGLNATRRSIANASFGAGGNASFSQGGLNASSATNLSASQTHLQAAGGSLGALSNLVVTATSQLHYAHQLVSDVNGLDMDELIASSWNPEDSLEDDDDDGLDIDSMSSGDDETDTGGYLEKQFKRYRKNIGQPHSAMSDQHQDRSAPFFHLTADDIQRVMDWGCVPEDSHIDPQQRLDPSGRRRTTMTTTATSDSGNGGYALTRKRSTRFSSVLQRRSTVQRMASASDHGERRGTIMHNGTSGTIDEEDDGEGAAATHVLVQCCMAPSPPAAVAKAQQLPTAAGTTFSPNKRDPSKDVYTPAPRTHMWGTSNQIRRKNK